VYSDEGMRRRSKVQMLARASVLVGSAVCRREGRASQDGAGWMWSAEAAAPRGGAVVAAGRWALVEVGHSTLFESGVGGSMLAHPLGNMCLESGHLPCHVAATRSCTSGALEARDTPGHRRA